MKLTYHGHSTFTVESGGKRVMIDPFLADNPRADIGPDAVKSLDAIVLSHGHFDHIADVESIGKRTGATVVSNFEIVTHFQGKGLDGHPMHIGGAHAFPWGRVKFTIAHHGSTGPNGEAFGNPMGILLTMGGKTLYHAGDTGVFLDMKLIAELNGPIDCACLPVGDNFTMGIADALKAAEFLGAKTYVPIHYDTWPPIEVDAQEFVRGVERLGARGKELQPGESLEI